MKRSLTPHNITALFSSYSLLNMFLARLEPNKRGCKPSAQVFWGYQGERTQLEPGMNLEQPMAIGVGHGTMA